MMLGLQLLLLLTAIAVALLRLLSTATAVVLQLCTPPMLVPTAPHTRLVHVEHGSHKQETLTSHLAVVSITPMQDLLDITALFLTIAEVAHQVVSLSVLTT
jgi:hypothetical protein